MTSGFTVDALIRSMALNSPNRHMLFLGAGASVTSGIASGRHCLWRWKREIYLSAQPGVSPLLLGDPTLPHVQERIQRWLDASGGFPTEGAPIEYQFYVERCFPLPRDRRRFFENLMKEGSPSVGYQALGLLIEAGHFRWLWTTNFDDLVDRGRPQERVRIHRQVGLDSKARLASVEPDDPALHQVFLHGDYRYDSIKNTGAELQALDREFRDALATHCTQYPLVVLGYSGRDDSVMEAFERGYASPGNGGLYWLTQRGSEVGKRVEMLMSVARGAGRHAEVIEFDGFDSFMVSLARYVLRGEAWATRVEDLARAQPCPRRSFDLSEYNATGGILKSNSWLLRAPDHVYQLDVPGIEGWKSLRAKLEPVKGSVAAGLMKGKVLAVGNRPDLARCFGDESLATLQQVPITPGEMFWDDGVVLSILREAVVRALADSALTVVQEGRRWFLVKSESRQSEKVGRDQITYFDAAELRVEQRGGSLYLSVIPDRYLPLDQQPLGYTREDVAVAKNRLLSRQWNRAFNEELNVWRTRLGLGAPAAVELVFPPGSEVGFRFRIEQGPVFTQVTERKPGGAPPKGPASLYRLKAFSVPEPTLRFHAGEDIHPIRGLVDHGPLELGAGFATVPTSIRVGVVAPSTIAKQMGTFLESLLVPHSDIETKREYLQSFPGFASAFRVPIEIPKPDHPGWVEVPSATRAQHPSTAFNEVLGNLTRAIDRLATGPQVYVVAICIPRSWAPFEKIESEEHDLDLHDQLKAYCAGRGIRTQLIREETVTKYQQAEVLWWLSLALYAKSMRTPWILAGNDEDVAYVGIGYAMDRRDYNKPIVLGCSHVFQATGLGLRFHLSQVKEPIFKRKKPYLGRQDALRLGVQTRQLFYESLGRLPRRALVCKRTPFIKEELDGLRAGLHGIDSVDTLTIEYEPAWRYLACEPRTGKAADFPVPRGTSVLLDGETFLLWVHGRVDRINEKGWAYYQGKTRIPTPLRVRRYSGSTPIERLAADLLGLSKMDWNTFDLYETMPAHVATPNKIARIGRFLERLSPRTLDYRLFM